MSRTPEGGESMDVFIQLLITGILVGSIYAFVALGWTLIYKCSGVLNLAMGELTLLGAYVCLAFYSWGIPFPFAVDRDARPRADGPGPRRRGAYWRDVGPGSARG